MIKLAKKSIKVFLMIKSMPMTLNHFILILSQSLKLLKESHFLLLLLLFLLFHLLHPLLFLHFWKQVEEGEENVQHV